MGYTGDREERITGRTARRGATGGARLGGQVWEGKDGGGGGGKWRRKGRGRMQRIRKERSPAPAYVMPSGHCQPAPALPLLSRAGAKGEGVGADGAKGQSCPRNRSRENSDRSQGLISIFGRSFACSLFEHPDDENSDDDARHRRREQYSPRGRGLSFSPDLSRSKGLGAGHRCPWQ